MEGPSTQATAAGGTFRTGNRCLRNIQYRPLLLEEHITQAIAVTQATADGGTSNTAAGEPFFNFFSFLLLSHILHFLDRSLFVYSLGLF